MRNHRRRRAAGVVLVDGARETLRAMESGLNLRGFYEPVDDSGEFSVEVDGLTDARRRAIELGKHRGVIREVFAKMCYGEAMQRCVAEFDAPGDRLADLPPLQPGLILVLDRVEKPGNLGAVFRSADAAGVAAVLLCDCPSDRFNSNAIRGSLGAVFSVPSASGTQVEVNEYLTQHVSRVAAMRVEGAGSLFEFDFRCDQVAVILGSEADGLGERWMTWGPPNEPRLVDAVKLPMAGQVDSLNVSVSAAIVAYEAVRQRSLNSRQSFGSDHLTRDRL
ncbi:TrmH family RNA methyltransferase [Neorhodopirellula pilleata]|uniref:TrmH family RNA methyltransferase n=1 Tax=Neorhodopirellula pilleata TaxID=2714738 RepID=UPI001E5652C5|nr:TrmH family RNA methyltransferase [Neorhodopirellula pilleata]